MSDSEGKYCIKFLKPEKKFRLAHFRSQTIIYERKQC